MWKIVTIGDICDKVVSGGTPNSKREEYYINGNIPWLKTKEVQNGRIYFTESYITKAGLENSSAKLIPPNSVILAMYGDGKTAGKVAINKIELATNQACCNLIVNKKCVDYEFLFYNLLGRYDELVRLKNGSGQQNLNLSIIKNTTINLPNLKTQKKIAYILSQYDKKIDKNISYIKSLQGICDALFWNMFGVFFENNDTDFIQSSYIKSKQNSCVFDNIIEVKNRNKEEHNYPVLSVVKEGEFKASEDVFTKQVYSKSTKNYKIVRRNQVAYNPARANIGSIAMLKEYDVGLVSPIYTVFEMKDTITPTFFYYYMKQPIFQEMIKHHAIGTTRQNFPFEAFKMFPMVVPPTELQLKFEEIAKPIEQKIAKLKEENEVLAEIRDTLLPKLMSGELPVEVGEN